MQVRQYGSLECTVLDPPQKVERLVVLCHGWGAPGTDLVPLASALCACEPSLQANTRFLFPAGPLAMAPGSRGWWALDTDRIYERIARGEVAAICEETPAGLPAARRQLMATVDLALREASLSCDRLVLGGFSQGAMLATDVALRLEECPDALCVLSGALNSAPSWSLRARQRRGLRVYQSHGTADPVLTFEVGQRLQQLLEEAGLKVSFEAFPDGHTIPSSVLRSLARHIAQP
jgi:phospholipase/carboxylesterase